MLTFLRKIRKSMIDSLPSRQAGGAVNKYLIYAIGEIALVVIGILIALQINNWNEKQKQIKELTSYAKSLSSDLILDIEMVYVNIRQGKRNVMRIDSLVKYTKDKKLNELSNLHLWLLSAPLSYRPYRWHRASLDELKNSGVLRYLNDEILIQMITDYEAFTRHMDEDYKEDKHIERGCEEWRNQVIDQYYVMHRNRFATMSVTKDRLLISQMDSVQRNSFSRFSFDSDPDFKIFWNDFTTDTLYLEAEKENRPLLTTDITQVHSMVNSMMVYRDGMRTRYANELPHLIEDAEAIIRRLEPYTLE